MDKREQKKAIWEIGRLEENICDKCEIKSRHYKDCEGCQTYERIKALGKKLGADNVKNGARNPIAPISKKEVKPMPKEDLTVERYQELKSQGKTDVEIREILKVGTNTLQEFKKQNRLTGIRISERSDNKNNKILELQNEIERLKKQLAEPTKEQIIQKNDEGILKQLEQENATLKENYAQLQKDMDDTAYELKALTKEKNHLAVENESLREKMLLIQKENEELKGQPKDTTAEQKVIALENVLRMYLGA